MEEVLDLVRREFKSASRVYSEEFGTYYDIDDEIVVKKFARFEHLHAVAFNAQNTIKLNFIEFGCVLYELRRDEIYKCVRQDAHGGTGYTNFYTFCSDVFGLKKQTVANMLRVVEEFVNKENGILDVQYMNFSYSQLVELASMEKYRERIPVTMSKRNIKRLKELYKDGYTPVPGHSVDDDLKEFQRRQDEKKEKANAEKNALNFIPAKKSDEVVGNSDVQPVGHQCEELAESDSEDPRLQSTPDVRGYGFDSIRAGLLCQLDLLNSVPGWRKVSELMSEALKEDRPGIICRTRELINLASEGTRYKEYFGELVSPESGKLELKNDKVRKEWLDDFRSWGLWRKFKELDLEFYRYDFENGASLIVEVGTGYNDYYDGKGCVHACERIKYSIIGAEQTKFSLDGISYTQVITWLSGHRNEI